MTHYLASLLTPLVSKIFSGASGSSVNGGNMDAEGGSPISSDGASTVEFIDLTKDSPHPAPGSKEAIREMWRKRQRERDLKRAASGNNPIPAGPSTSGGGGDNIRGRTRSATRAVSGNGTVVVVDEDEVDVIVVTDSPDAGQKRKKLKADDKKAPPPPRPVSPTIAFKCPICLETNIELKASGTGLISMPCGHVVCAPCSESLSTMCPVCRKKLTKKTLRPLFL